MDVIIIDDDECEGPVDMDLQKAIEQSLGRQSEGEAGCSNSAIHERTHERTRDSAPRKRRVQQSVRLGIASIRRRMDSVADDDEEEDVMDKMAEEEETPNHHRGRERSREDALCDANYDARKKKSRKPSPDSTASLPCWSNDRFEGEDEVMGSYQCIHLPPPISSRIRSHLHPHKDLEQQPMARRQWYSEGEKVLVRAPELSNEASFYNAIVKSADDQSSPPVYSLEIIDDNSGCNYYGSSLTVRSTPDTMFVYLLKQEPVWLRVMTSGCSARGEGGLEEGKEKSVITSYERVLVISVDMEPVTPVVWVKWPPGSSQSAIYPGEFATSFECIEQIKGWGESSKRSLKLLQQGEGEEAAVKSLEPGPMQCEQKGKDEGSKGTTEVIEIF